MVPTPAAVLASALAAEPGLRLAVLFGSAARDEAGDRSDLDVAVIGPDQGHLSPLEVRLARATGRQVEVVSLEAAPPLLRFEIAREGRVLVESQPHLWTDFKVRAMVDWWDWAPTQRMLDRAAMARVRAEAEGGSR